MSKDWEYAKLVQEAAQNGGRDKWISMIKDSAYQTGVTDTKNALIAPLLAVGVVVGVSCVIGAQKLRKMVVERKKSRLEKMEKAAIAEKCLKDDLENLENGCDDCEVHQESDSVSEKSVGLNCGSLSE